MFVQGETQQEYDKVILVFNNAGHIVGIKNPRGSGNDFRPPVPTVDSAGNSSAMSVSYTVNFGSIAVAGGLSFNPANQNANFSPTGTGTVTINPSTLSNMNNVAIGQTTPQAVKTSNLQAGTFTDISGTPGAGTSSGTRGRAAFAAAASSVVITSTLVTAASTVLVQLATNDTTLKSVSVIPGAGSFTVTGNAAATGTTVFDFLVIN